MSQHYHKHRSVSVNRKQKFQPSIVPIQAYSREACNFKRNNSNLMSTCLTWDFGEESYEDEVNERRDYYQQDQHEHNKGRNQQEFKRQGQGEGRGQVQGDNMKKQVNRSKQNQIINKRGAKSAKKASQGVKNKIDLSIYQKTAQQLQKQRIQQQQRRQKISSYIDSMIPFSRQLTNSKFQQYYKKSAPQAYGNGNTTQAIGGSVYGNNYRSFNVNPHDYMNNPKHYQSHTTALNFAHRTKRNDEERWKTLQKELGKKLNLHEKNQTIKEGKKVVYVDVDNQNMEDVLKENNQFVKAHREEIRNAENQYKKNKQLKSQAEKAKFYREKAQKIQQNLLQKTRASQSVYQNPRPQNQRINQQVIFKHHNPDGSIRYGADRHALTCFVDMNFPQNDKLYTQQLKKRMPIFPTEVQQRHKYLDEKRHENYQTDKKNIYPKHYLLPCNEQPEIKKMLMEKGKIGRK